jgi:DnaK suppressor protein
MRKRDISRCRTLLQQQLGELVGHEEKTVHQMVSREAEELPDPNDRGTAETERSWALRLGDRDRKLVAKVQAALGRIEAGTFGVCETCGRPISSARLKARPVTTLCIDCKTESESTERS